MSYAVLIPSKGRPKSLQKLFDACPMLNAPTTYVGIEDGEIQKYDYAMRDRWDKVERVSIVNPWGITSCAREQLRVAALKIGYDRYVLSDDNCRFSDQSLRTLVATQTISNAVVAGAHPTAKHFHADKIATTTKKWPGKLFTYEQVGMIFWCIPGHLYEEFKYPPDCYYDDVYFILWCLSQGFTQFLTCPYAPFEKKRHEAGGTGNAAQRVRKMAMGLERLAGDFPQWMVPSWVQTRVPYTAMLKAAAAGFNGYPPK